MKLDVRYFGSIAEEVKKEREELFLTEGNTLNEFSELVLSIYPQLQGHVFKFSVNQELVDDSIELSENDEVALLPPFAGG